MNSNLEATHVNYKTEVVIYFRHYEFKTKSNTRVAKFSCDQLLRAIGGSLICSQTEGAIFSRGRRSN